jgi:FtsH-binding integral membrane protein
MMQQPAYGQQPTNPQQIVYQGVDQNADMAPSAYPEAVPQDMATGQLKEEDEARCDQLSFLRKVLGIVAGQLLLTFICIVGASYSYDFGLFCTSLGCQLTSFFLYIFSMIALLCSRGLRHSVPANYIVLGLFTASMAFMLSGVTAWLTPESVLMAIGVLVIVLSMMWIGVLCVDNKAKLMMGVLIAVFAAIILQLCLMIPLLISGFVEGMWVLYCFLGVIICAGLIYFDLFIIMLAGKYAMDEYIYCAILLYVDIIRMLIYLLMIFGKAK